ncbi:MAG: hypothetical protein J6S81_02220 [Treponema sp.]|nr:hypothetical protein [Treponema sp.]
MTIKAEVKTMALNNLFDMVKADRYTTDGREALIKAQEAETEDKVYQIGEISQKTGLQKTANGWVKPKSGKQPGAKKEEPKNVNGAEVDKIYERQLKRIKELKAKGFTDEQIDNDKIIKQTKEDMRNVGKKPESKPAAGVTVRQGYKTKQLDETMAEHLTKNLDAYKGYDQGSMEELVLEPSGYELQGTTKSKSGKSSSVYTKGSDKVELFFDKDGELENVKTSASTESKPAESKIYINKEGHRNFRAALEDNPTSSYDFEKTVKFAVPMSQEDKTELKKLQLFMSDEGADYKQALRSRASNLVDGNKSNGDHFPEKEKSIMKIAKAVGYDKELHRFIEEEYKGYDLGYSEDAAPRVLTGDTRIRVRKA